MSYAEKRVMLRISQGLGIKNYLPQKLPQKFEFISCYKSARIVILCKNFAHCWIARTLEMFRFLSAVFRVKHSDVLLEREYSLLKLKATMRF